MVVENKRDNEHEALREARILVGKFGGDLQDKVTEILKILEDPAGTSAEPTLQTLRIGQILKNRALSDSHTYELDSMLS